jgi:hypothetical protein
LSGPNPGKVIASRAPGRQGRPVTKLCIFVGMTVGGIAGSMLADAFDMGMFSVGGFVLSGVGSMVGVYAGWKLARKIES